MVPPTLASAPAREATRLRALSALWPYMRRYKGRAFAALAALSLASLATLAIPLVMSWPGHLPEGVVTTLPLMHVDIMPTLLDLLANGEIRLLGLLSGATNHTFLVEVAGDGHTAEAVYKPRRGERPLWDFPPGTLHLREVAAYRLAGALGWPAVPATVLRDGPSGVGAVQAFVDADPREHFFTLRHRLDDFRPVAAFDVLANNADRKSVARPKAYTSTSELSTRSASCSICATV